MLRRIIGWLFLGTLIAAGLLWPLVFHVGSEASEASDPVVITDYDADFNVRSDGTLDAVETITGMFPSNRHGIFRYWDVMNANSPTVRQVPEITSILLDGEPVSYQMLWEDADRFRVAKIGDPDVTLDPGSHVYELRYTIAGVLDPGEVGANRDFAVTEGDPDATSAFYWNVVAPSWNNVIQRVHITATLPGAVTGAQCSVGTGVGRKCTDLSVRGDTVEFTAAGLMPRTPVTLRAGVDLPTPPRESLPWSQRWDRVSGQSVTWVFVVAGLTVLAAGGAFLAYRTTVEPEPGFPLQYTPPVGLGPVQIEYIRTESVPKNGLTATLYYLADRRFVELRHVSDKQWNIRGLAHGAAWADLDWVSISVGAALRVMSPGAEFEARKTVAAGKKLDRAKTDMTDAVTKWALDDGLMVKRKKELWVRTANALAFILAICGFFRWGFPSTMWGLPFAAFFAFSVRAWADGVGTRRTPAGRQLWSQAGGFHRVIATDSAESRFDFAARRDLYTAYIPFAVAAGSAALWARKYQETTGAVAPQPDWYHSSSATTSHWAMSNPSGGADFDSFESALSSSIGAYTASLSSSSGSSSSGGSSGGGGGGGGGGGSW